MKIKLSLTVEDITAALDMEIDDFPSLMPPEEGEIMEPMKTAARGFEQLNKVVGAQLAARVPKLL